MQTKTTFRNRALFGGLVLLLSALLTTQSSAQTAVATAASTAAATSAMGTMAATAATMSATSDAMIAATTSATNAATGAATSVGTAAAAPILQTIQSARAAADGASVLVQGTVTVATGLFDDTARSLYIQDATGGVNVYFNKGGLPAFVEGDTLQVSGKMLTFANHREIAPAALDAVKKLNTDAPKPLTPVLIHSADGMTYAGQLVRIQGMILSVAADYFVLTDSADVNQGNVNVYIYDTTGIGFNTIAAQQNVCVTGIVDPYNAAVEILPRHPDDIQTGNCPK